jgi:hypothetical protein
MGLAVCLGEHLVDGNTLKPLVQAPGVEGIEALVTARIWIIAREGGETVGDAFRITCR